MRARRRRREANTEQTTEPFFSKERREKTSAGAGAFFQQPPSVQRKLLSDAPKGLIQKDDEKDKKKDAGVSIDAGVAKDAGAATDAGMKKDGGAPTDAGTPAPDAGFKKDPAKTKGAAAAGAFDITTIRNEYVSTIFAEAVAGQETDIAWIYYNLISAKGAAGLKASAAYSGKSDNFKIAMTGLGSKTYGADKLRDPWVKKSKVKEETVQDYVDKNGYFKTVAGPRLDSIAAIVDAIIAKPADNPYPGWTGQGNLNDFNNISQPKSSYWKMARAYFWLQEDGKAPETLVKVIGKGVNVQFIFNGKKIEEYYKTTKLPEDVPLYPRAAPKKEAEVKPKP